MTAIAQALPFEAQRECRRRESNKTRVLARLQAGPANTRQLIEIGGCRAPARVWELKRDGWIVDVDDLGNGLFRYTLRGRIQIERLERL